MCSSSSSLSSSAAALYPSTNGYGLIVEGIPLGSGGQFVPRLTMKRIYDTKCFRPERYRHEVANHYRDYKLQQHLYQHHRQSNHHQKHQHHHHRGQRRRRRRQFFGGVASEEASRVSASLASQYASQFRDVWPTHRHYFPRSDDTSTGQTPPPPPPPPTYNDAVRRIRSAHSCEQLRHLVERQLQRHRLPWRSNSSNSYNNDEALGPELRGSQSSDGVDYKLNIHKHSAENPQRRPPARAEQQVQVDFYAYLQLASGYYERGLQADLKYLQSIGQQQHKHKQHQQQQQQQRRCNAIRPLDEDVSYVLQRSESPAQRLIGLLKSLRGKAASHKQAGQTEIRVNIRSVRREKDQQQQEQQQQEQQQPEEEEDQEQEQEPEEDQEEELDSMCDYYAPAAAATNEAAAAAATSRASVVASVATTSAHQRRLYEIIDNLSHLSIAGDTTATGGGGGGGGGTVGRQHLQLTLPQITFTDCSSTGHSSLVTLQMMPNNSNNERSRAT